MLILPRSFSFIVKRLSSEFIVKNRQHFTKTVRTNSSLFVVYKMDSVEDLNNIAVDEQVIGKDDGRPDYPWKRAKKVALMLSFSGKNYYGMQRNPDAKINTIEDELLTALAKSGAIDPDWEKAPHKAFFARASRTDKGVSAARMITSLKMLPDNSFVSTINSHLPLDIRLQGLVRVTKNFNCHSQAEARTYLYLLPTFAFSPLEDTVTEAWRCGPDTIANVNDVFKHFIGSHFYHNYTSGKLPMEPSSRRYIHEFEAGAPFEKEGLEWCIIRVKGQSFMLHQIRKMIGLCIAIVRGHTNIDCLRLAWGQQRIDVPRAPGLGLMLDTIHYNKYNERYGNDGQHAKLDWVEENEAVEQFKDDFIFSDIIKTEIEEKSMLSWLGNALILHSFEPRHFESSEKKQNPLTFAAHNLTRHSKNKEIATSDELEDNSKENNSAIE